MRFATRCVGLVGGIGWGATADYYRLINLDIAGRLGGRHSANLAVRSLDLAPLLEMADDVPAVSAVIEQACVDLVAAGSEVLGIASFTGHRYAGRLRDHAQARFVDLVDVVGDALRALPACRVAVWATSYALGDAALMARLARHAGKELVAPDVELRPQIDRIVFDELARQELTPASLDFFRALLDRQVTGAGVEAVLLATTDLAPVTAGLGSRIPVLDATVLHASALVDAAMR